MERSLGSPTTTGGSAMITSASVAVEVRDLTFCYDSKAPVLQGVSFSVPPGSTLAILGPSGSGKSTLIRLLCGLLRNRPSLACSGSIRTNGDTDTRGLRATGKVGLMFQVPALLPHLTVRANVALPLDAIGDPTNKAERVDALIKAVGLSGWADALPRVLSEGMKTRVALARTFVTRPALLLLDEPFSSLDVGWRLAMYSHLQSLRGQDAPTTILVTHDIHEAILIANQIVVLSHHGRVVRILDVSGRRPDCYDPPSVSRWQTVQASLYLTLADLIYTDHAARDVELSGSLPPLEHK
jgi:NitT/TauT family transport system ATP-binding protein